ncbi:hypothetical protein BpHYR1_049977 [Brachionus plicatilis]|uniref:Uncharacterized protein n=1 Tax=Brachionus plicatilis TaxID=10195 RepID=A0A3M7Q2H7_BRAPC|nr:hypothetical protein BpHYR1_049977 [Brachionus plicatilis]
MTLGYNSAFLSSINYSSKARRSIVSKIVFDLYRKLTGVVMSYITDQIFAKNMEFNKEYNLIKKKIQFIGLRGKLKVTEKKPRIYLGQRTNKENKTNGGYSVKNYPKFK